MGGSCCAARDKKSINDDLVKNRNIQSTPNQSITQLVYNQFLAINEQPALVTIKSQPQQKVESVQRPQETQETKMNPTTYIIINQLLEVFKQNAQAQTYTLSLNLDQYRIFMKDLPLIQQTVNEKSQLTLIPVTIANSPLSSQDNQELLVIMKPSQYMQAAEPLFYKVMSNAQDQMNLASNFVNLEYTFDPSSDVIQSEQLLNYISQQFSENQLYLLGIVQLQPQILECLFYKLDSPAHLPQSQYNLHIETYDQQQMSEQSQLELQLKEALSFNRHILKCIFAYTETTSDASIKVFAVYQSQQSDVDYQLSVAQFPDQLAQEQRDIEQEREKLLSGVSKSKADSFVNGLYVQGKNLLNTKIDAYISQVEFEYGSQIRTVLFNYDIEGSLIVLVRKVQ
eukprot:403345532